MSAQKTPRRSYVNEAPWPDTLPTYVTTPTHPQRAFGYLVEEDLAVHYTFAGHALLALTGELPDACKEKAFDLACHWLAPMHVGHAPAHAAVLARISGTGNTGVMGAGLVTLLEWAGSRVEAHAPLFEAIRGGRPAGEAYLAIDDEERASVARLRTALGRIPFEVPALAEDLSREAALYALLFACGVQSPQALVTTHVLTNSLYIAAEASHWKRGGFRAYPTNLPEFRYEGADDGQ